MILLAEMSSISGQRLAAAIELTFRNAGDQDIPNLVPQPPQTWEGGFKRLTNQVGLSGYSLDLSYARIKQFFDPILSGEAKDLQWNPDSWSWK